MFFAEPFSRSRSKYMKLCGNKNKNDDKHYHRNYFYFFFGGLGKARFVDPPGFGGPQKRLNMALYSHSVRPALPPSTIFIFPAAATTRVQQRVRLYKKTASESHMKLTYFMFNLVFINITILWRTSVRGRWGWVFNYCATPTLLEGYVCEG